jgi:ParB family chromosome partitioning protein
LALEKPKYSIEQIAAKVGKHPSFVASRLKMIDLEKTVVDAFYANEIGVGHALLLAKLPADQQKQALSACFKEVYNGGQKQQRRKQRNHVRSLFEEWFWNLRQNCGKIAAKSRREGASK